MDLLKRDHCVVWRVYAKWIVPFAILFGVFFGGQAFADALYDYDELGRLVSVTYDDGHQIVYRYDDAGNRTEHVVSPVTIEDLEFGAVGDDEVVPQATSATFYPLANDNNTASGSIYVVHVGDPAHGSVDPSGAVDPNGAGVSIVYTPDPDFVGPDSFLYTISDDQACETETPACRYSTAIVTVDVQYNTGGLVLSDDTFTAQQTLLNPIPVLANDSSPQVSALEIIAVTRPVRGVDPDDPEAGYVGASTYVDGSQILYTAGPIFATNSFRYTVRDLQGNTASAIVVVDVVPYTSMPPVTPDYTVSGVPTETTTLLNPIVHVYDPDGDAFNLGTRRSRFTGPYYGRRAFDVSQGDILSYRSFPGFEGVDFVLYSARDENGAFSEGEIRIEMAPSVAFGPRAFAEYQALEWHDEAELEITGTASALVINNDFGVGVEYVPSSASASYGTVAVVVDGSGDIQFDYTANSSPPYASTYRDVINYTLEDDNQVQTTGHFYIYEAGTAGANAAPLANDDSYTLASWNATSYVVMSNDSDPDGDAIEITGFGSVMSRHGRTTIFPPDTIEYMPNPGFVGDDIFTYIVTDAGGATSEASVAISVTGSPNTVPMALDDYFLEVGLDQTVALAVLDNDSDADSDPLLIVEIADPANGTAVLDVNGEWIIYTPDTGYLGSDTFSYIIGDGRGGSATGFVIVEVTLTTNAAPIAVDDSFNGIAADATTSLPVLDNDSDPDGNPLIVLDVTAPMVIGATIVDDAFGGVSYTAPFGFTGRDDFSYVVYDGDGGQGTASVQVWVGSPNQPPSPGGGQYNMLYTDNTISINIISNASDPEHEHMTIVSSTDGIFGGTTTITSLGRRIRYRRQGYVAPGTDDRFTFVVRDEWGNESTGAVLILFYTASGGSGGGGGPGGDPDYGENPL